MAVKGAKALEVWARRVTDGYPNVKITNMSSSWKNGLAFCAIVHRFRPDLIDFTSLDPDQIERNCSTVFAIAESELGIPSLLDPADMAECKSPDRLSILTYLSEFYHKFKAEKSPQGSPQTSKKDETAETGTKSCPDLKRKDSCDSGVSVSPLGSVCNSPPYQRKESPAPITTTTTTTTLPKKETDTETKSPTWAPYDALVSKLPKETAVAELVNSEQIQEPKFAPVSEKPCGLENLLKQRLKVNADVNTQRKTCHNNSSQRWSLLKSMISVPSADDTTIITPKSNSQDSEKIIKQNRRHTMDPVPSSKSLLLDVPPKGNVFQLSQSFSSNNSNKFVSKTTISLSPNPPIKYAPNNSVTCDIKSNSLNPRPWKEPNPSKTHSEDFLHSLPSSSSSETETSPVANHLLQVKVNESENKIPPNRIVINSVGDFTCKITSADDNAESVDEGDKVKIISDNTFKSRMMKFERMINTNEAKDDDITISGVSDIKAKRVDSNEDEKLYRNKNDISRHARRKTISLPPSLVLSMNGEEDSRLSF